MPTTFLIPSQLEQLEAFIHASGHDGTDPTKVTPTRLHPAAPRRGMDRASLRYPGSHPRHPQTPPHTHTRPCAITHAHRPCLKTSMDALLYPCRSSHDLHRRPISARQLALLAAGAALRSGS